MAFTYNDEVVDLLLKKTLGTAYTSSTLVPGQETPLLQRIQNNQIFGRPLTNFPSSLFDWSTTTAVTGGGTVSFLEYVHGETDPESFIYIKKYEEIPMSVVAGTNNRAWKPTESSIQDKFKNVILGKPNFLFSLTTNITNYETILSSNSTFKPIVNNGVLVFLGNSIPLSTNIVKMKQVFIYEGSFGAAAGLKINDLTDVIISAPGNGQPLIYNTVSNIWEGGTVGRDYIPIDKLNDLTDVNTTGIQNKQTLIYDTNDQTYKPASIPENLNDLTDVTITGTPSANDGLVYDGTTWKPAPVSEPVTGLDFLPDVDISSNLLADNKSLLYDSASQKWKVASVQLPITSINDIPDVDTTGVISKYALGWNATESKWKPQEVGDVIRTLGDLRDVDLGNMGTEIPQWEQVKKIEASDGGENDNFGTACAMDISFSVVGAYRTSATIGGQPATYVGSAYIFKRGGDSSTWTDHQKLAPDSPGFGMKFGSSISIRNNCIAIGAPSHSYTDGSTYTEAGSIFLFDYDALIDTYGIEKDGGVTPPLYKEDSILRPTSPTNYDSFGADVDISGVYMIVGAPQPDTTSNGKAYVFKHNGTNWNQIKILTASDGAANDQFGHSVAINDSFAFVGTRRHNGYRGAVYIYKKNEGGSDNWGGGTQFQKIIISDSSPYDYFGTDIACYGNDLIATAPKSTDKPGEAYLIALNLAQGYWGTDVGSGIYNETNIVRVGVRTKSNNDGFGSSIQMGPSYGIVGASLSDVSGNDSGAAFVLQNTGEGYWEVLKNIRASDLQAGDEFGISVGMFDRYATVGAWKEDEPNNAGAAYIFNVPELEGGTRCLVYDQDTSRWKVGIVTSSGSGVFVSQLDDLTDVEVSGNKLGDIQATDGQGLIYDQVNKRWIPGNVQQKLNTLGDVPGVVTTGLASGHSLIYDGTNWNAAAVQASINSINDIPGVDIGNTGNNQALSAGQALVYNDASGGWVNGVGSGGSGGSASGVSTDNKTPDNPENGNIYYDTSRNAFYGYMDSQWLQFLMQSTPYLIGHPPILRNPPGIGFDTPYADRIEFSWDNPKQYPVGFKPTNNIDKVDGTLYLPAINKIKFGYCLGNTYETANAIGGEIEIGGKSVNNRVVDQSSTVRNQKLYNSSGNNKLTNKLILYTTGSAVASGLTGWNSINSNFESDWIQTDGNGNQVYYCNPRSTNYSITASQNYTFRFYLSNSLASTDYNYKDITTSSLQVAVPSAIFTKTSTENGWYTEIIRDGDIHKLKVIIHNSALKHSSVNVTTSATTDGVFFEAFEVQYRSANAVDNINNKNSAITWSAWSNVGFDAPNTSGIDDNKTIPQTTPLTSPATTTTNPYKLITIPQNDNKFYQIQVRAKNQLGVNFGPWSTSYTVRFTKPSKVVWEQSAGANITNNGIIDTEAKFLAINSGNTLYMYLANGTFVASFNVRWESSNGTTTAGLLYSSNPIHPIFYWNGGVLKFRGNNLKTTVEAAGGTYPSQLYNADSTWKEYLQDNGLGGGEVGWYLRTQEQLFTNGYMQFVPTTDKWKMRVKWDLPDSSPSPSITNNGIIDSQAKFEAIEVGTYIYMYLSDETFVAVMEVTEVVGTWQNIKLSGSNEEIFRWSSLGGAPAELCFFGLYLKQAVEAAGGAWPSSLTEDTNLKRYTLDNGLGGGEVGWYLRTVDQGLVGLQSTSDGWSQTNLQIREYRLSINRGEPSYNITNNGIINTQALFEAIQSNDSNPGGDDYIWMYLADGTLVAKMRIDYDSNTQLNIQRNATGNHACIKWQSGALNWQPQLKECVEYAGGTWPAGLTEVAGWKTYTSDWGLGGGEVGWYLRSKEQFAATYNITNNGIINTQALFEAIQSNDSNPGGNNYLWMYLGDGTFVAKMRIDYDSNTQLNIQDSATGSGGYIQWSDNTLKVNGSIKTSVEYAGGTWPAGLTDSGWLTYTSDNGLGGGEVGWYLRTQEQQAEGSYTIIDHIEGTTDSGIIQYDYVLSNSSHVEEGVKSESESRAAYTGTHSNKQTNPSFSFKIEARNYLFGNSGNENQWSVISESTSIVTPATPNTPVHDSIKFYEQNNDDGQFYPFIPTDDYLAYEWAEPTEPGATGLNIDAYKVAYSLGEKGVNLTNITFNGGTDELDVGDEVIIITSENFQSASFTNTSYTVDSKTNSIVTLNSSTGVQGNRYIFKIQYVNVTDKILGGDPFYKRIYKASNLMGNPPNFDYCVEAINYFNSSWSSGFVKPTALTPLKPDPFNIDTNRPVIQILNNGITIKVDEPVNTTTSYSNGDNYDPHSLSMELCTLQPHVAGTQKNDVYIVPTPSENPIVIQWVHPLTNYMSGTNLNLQGTTGAITYYIKGRNTLNSTYNELKSITFTINAPNPSQFSQAPLFEWNGASGSNQFKLTLRVGNPGANFIKGSGSSPNYVASTYAPITNANTGDLQLTAATHILNETDKLQWNINYTADTATSELNSELGTSGAWGDPKWGGTYIVGDYVISHIGDLVENTTYTVHYRCRNQYNSSWLTQNSPQIKMLKPNAVGGGSANISFPSAATNRSAGEVSITLNWNKPTQPGFWHKHNNEGSLTADPNYPNIYQYSCDLWPQSSIYTVDSALDMSTTNYTAGNINNCTFQLRADNYAGGGNNGGNDPQFTSNNIIITSNATWSNGNAFTGIGTATQLQNATVGGNAANNLTIHPDHQYYFRIKAANWYFKSSNSDINTFAANGGSVPKTIGNADCVIRTGYTPILDATTANYTTSATASHYGLYNASNNTASNLASVPINLTGLNQVWSSSPGQVILNQQKYRPQSHNFINLQFNFGSDSSQEGRNKDSPQYTDLPVNGWKCSFDFGTPSDIYNDTHSCAQRWYKGTTCRFKLNATNIGNLNDTVLGKSIDVNIKFIYLAGGVSSGPNGASQSQNTITYTIASSKYFDKCTDTATFSTDPVWTYTPFKCYGLPILLSRGNGSQTFSAAYTVDNKSKYFVMTNYIVKVNIGDKTNTIEKTLSDHSKEAWDTAAGTASGTANKFKLAANTTFAFTVNQDKAYSNGTRATFTLNNIAGQMFYGTKGIKFIYDDDTLEFIADQDWNGYDTANISSTGSGTAGSGLAALTKIKVPNDFNIGADTASSLNGQNWNQGTITKVDTCVGQPKLIIHRGKFMSPGYFKSGNGFQASLPVPSDYHSDVATFWNDYDASSTNADTKHTRVGSGVTGSTHDETFKNNFRWCMYEFLVTNTSSSPWSGLTNFSIKLGDSNNTNISRTDIISSDPSTLNGGVTFNCEIFYKFILIKSNGTLDFEGRWWKAVVAEQGLASSGTTPASVATAVGESFNANNGAAVLIEPPSNNTTWVNGGRRLIFSVKSHGCKQNEKIRIIIAIGLKKDSVLFIKDVFRGSNIYNDGTTY